MNYLLQTVCASQRISALCSASFPKREFRLRLVQEEIRIEVCTGRVARVDMFDW